VETGVWSASRRSICPPERTSSGDFRTDLGRCASSLAVDEPTEIVAQVGHRDPACGPDLADAADSEVHRSLPAAEDMLDPDANREVRDVTAPDVCGNECQISPCAHPRSYPALNRDERAMEARIPLPDRENPDFLENSLDATPNPNYSRVKLSLLVLICPKDRQVSIASEGGQICRLIYGVPVGLIHTALVVFCCNRDRGAIFRPINESIAGTKPTSTEFLKMLTVV